MGLLQQSCRKCGCTDNDCRQCYEKTGGLCTWVEEDLCSACVENDGPLFLEEGVLYFAIENASLAGYKALSLHHRINFKDSFFAYSEERPITPWWDY